jgi:hypothetical protein
MGKRGDQALLASAPLSRTQDAGRADGELAGRRLIRNFLFTRSGVSGFLRVSARMLASVIRPVLLRRSLLRCYSVDRALPS